ncbi:MAG: hypothetical protein F6K28_56445 [Microcoleus sp. SIO2G3]|nr:hypothetical protein [Microcoleus sp. SIO2G3]
MKTQSLSRSPWLALSLLGIQYALLGWFLSAYHIFWGVSAFVVVVTSTVAWKSNPILEYLIQLISQKILAVVGVCLLISLSIVLTLTHPAFFSLILLPTLTLLYVLLEMRSTNLKQTDIFLWSVAIAGLGLGLGEIVDLFISPSMRY